MCIVVWQWIWHSSQKRGNEPLPEQHSQTELIAFDLAMRRPTIFEGAAGGRI